MVKLFFDTEDLEGFKNLRGLCMVLFLLMLLLPVFSYGQNIAIANEKLNIAYAGIPNPITIVVEGHPAGQIMVSTDNGTMVNKGNGHYDYTPANQGKAVFKIGVKMKTVKQIGEIVYRIKQVPIPIAQISPTKEARKKQHGWDWESGLTVTMSDTAFKTAFTILSFDILLLGKNAEFITSVPNEGARFGALAKVVFSKARPGDVIVFRNIRCKFPNGNIRKLDDLVVKN